MHIHTTAYLYNASAPARKLLYLSLHFLNFKKCKAYLTQNVKRAILRCVKGTLLICFSVFVLWRLRKCSERSDDLLTRIQEFRKERKVTQNELADAVDVTRQTIISLENGRYKASLVLAHKLAQFFNVSIEDLFIFNEEDENL